MKDNCEKFRDMMFDYVENGSNDELEAHLSVCEACRGELEECKKLLASVKESAPTPPASLKQDVMLAVAADAKLRRRQRLVKRVSAVAAAFAVCVGIGIAAVASGMFGRFDVALDMEASGNANAPEAGDVAGGFAPDASDDKVMDGAALPDGEYTDGTYISGTDVHESEAADVAATLEKTYGYESVVIFVLKGDEAEKAFALLCDEFEASETDGGLYVFDAADAAKFASRVEELSGGMRVYFDAYADSDSPDVAAVYVDE